MPTPRSWRARHEASRDARLPAVGGIRARARPDAGVEPVRPHGLAHPRRVRQRHDQCLRANARRLPVARHRVRPAALRWHARRAMGTAARRGASQRSCPCPARGPRRDAVDRYVARPRAWDGKTLRAYPQFDDKMIHALHEDREGTLWVGVTVGTEVGQLCTIRSGATECHGGDGRFGLGVGALYEQADGTLWAASGLDRVWRLKPDPLKAYSVPGTIGNLQVLTENESGAMIVGTLDGIHKIAHGRVEPYSLSGTARKFKVSALLRAKDGGLWIGTRDAGLLHAHGGRTEVFTHADGLSG